MAQSGATFSSGASGSDGLFGFTKGVNLPHARNSTVAVLGIDWKLFRIAVIAPVSQKVYCVCASAAKESHTLSSIKHINAT